jgi:hypothetical protein
MLGSEPAGRSAGYLISGSYADEKEMGAIQQNQLGMINVTGSDHSQPI